MARFWGSYRAEVQSVSLARRDVREFVRAHGGSETLVARIAIAVSEAVGNAVLHAYVGYDTPGEVRVVVEFVDQAEGGGLRVIVEDDGRGMMPRFDSPGSGMGLPIIEQTTDHYEVRTSLSGGNEVCMRFALVDQAAQPTDASAAG